MLRLISEAKGEIAYTEDYQCECGRVISRTSQPLNAKGAKSLIWELLDVLKQTGIGIVKLLVQIARAVVCRHVFTTNYGMEQHWTGRRFVGRRYIECDKCGRRKTTVYL